MLLVQQVLMYIMRKLFVKVAKMKADQALLCRNEEPENKQSQNKGKFGDEIGVLPPKIAAMHKVGWNMKKGIERWLNYGAATGVVHQQEIDASEA
ncbi:unnamed protein product [Ilex paraguariensis]|uniref:Uncharacterized protein n=1 Tax=Ilex paraguariensis TaxID=185542 RepID=A0ABC8TIT6_9AQUA